MQTYLICAPLPNLQLPEKTATLQNKGNDDPHRHLVTQVRTPTHGTRSRSKRSTRTENELLEVKLYVSEIRFSSFILMYSLSEIQSKESHSFLFLLIKFREHLRPTVR